MLTNGQRLASPEANSATDVVSWPEATVVVTCHKTVFCCPAVMHMATALHTTHVLYMHMYGTHYICMDATHTSV